MATRKFKDKNNNDYTVEVDENNFNKEIKNDNKFYGSAEFVVKDTNGQEVGFGTFRVICTANHNHLPDNEMFKGLITKGAAWVRKTINEGGSIESGGYNIRTRNCREE